MKNHLPNNIKALRNLHSLTQEQLAENLGKSRAVLNQYELGNVNPPIEILLKLKQIYNINIDSFITRKCEWKVVK